MRYAPDRIGWFGSDLIDDTGDVIDAAGKVVKGAADVATSIVDDISKAGHEIGAVLKFIAPIVAFYPGLGTAFSVAIYAAGAAASADKIGDALIGTASAAMPPGLPRIGFDSGVSIVKDVANGRNAFTSTIDAGRSAAQQADPSGRAVAAFDTGVAIARGGKVTDETIKMARANVVNGGTTATAAFDAGVAIAKGEKAPAILVAAGRDLIATMGGPVAQAAFDAGVALSYGQTLQDAGFDALQDLVAGNDSSARAVMFIEIMTRAFEQGKPLVPALVDGLGGEVQRAVGTLSTDQALQPLIDAFHVDPSLLDFPTQFLSGAWGGVPEPLVRAAKAIVKDIVPDLQRLLRPANVVGRTNDASAVAADAARFAAIVAANPGVPIICLRADDAKSRNSPVYPTLAAQCAALSAPTEASVALVTNVAQLRSSSPSGTLLVGAPPPKPLPIPVPPPPPPPRFVPPAVTDAIVQTGAPPVPGAASTGVVSDVALGGVIALAAIALFWWAKS